MVGRCGRSRVWLLSRFLDRKRSVVQCNLCPTQIKYVGNTTNIARHLEIKHPQEYGEVVKLVPSGGINTRVVIGQQHYVVPTVVNTQQQQHEENAIQRILEQHNKEKRQLDGTSEGNGVKTKTILIAPKPGNYVSPSVNSWKWHTPLVTPVKIKDEHSVTDNSMPGGGVHDAHSGGSSSHSGSLSGLEAVMAVAAAAAAANPSSLPPTGGGLDGGGESDGGGTSMGLPNVSTGGGLGGMEDRQSSHDAAGLNPLHMPNLLNSLSSPSPTSRHTSANSTAGNGDNYQLRHNNHLSLVFNQLAEDEDFMDVTLTAEGKSVKAHKSVLSAVSPYFSEVLRSNPCQHPIVIMPRDIAYNELSSMIKYIYRGEVTVSAEDLPSLLKTAQILQISGLSDGNLNNSPQMKNISRNSAPQNVTPNSMDNSTSTNNPVSLFSSSNSNLSLSTFNTVKNIFNSNYNAMNKQSHNKSSTITPQRLINIAPRPIIDENDKSQTDEGNSLPMDDSHDPNNEQTMLNPSDFMDLDMTCVKEELQSDEEEDHSELMDAPSTPKEVTTPPPIQHPSLSTSPATPSTSNSNDPPKSDVTMKIKDDQSNIEKELKQQNSLKTLANLANMNTNLSPGGSSDINEDNTAVENTSDDNLTEPSPNVCPYCSNYITTSELNTHLSSKHAFKPAFVCSTCNRVYTRKHSHENHYKKCSSEES